MASAYASLLSFIMCPDAVSAESTRDLLAAHDALVQSVIGWSRWRFSPETRADLAQKIRLEIVRQPHVVAEADDPAGLLKQICIRRCIDEVRRQIRERQILVSGDDDPPDPADEAADPVRLVLRAERARAIRRLLGTLDDTCRTALHQFYVEGLSYLQMAGRLGIATNTVGSRLAKCVAKLRALARRDDELREYFRS